MLDNQGSGCGTAEGSVVATEAGHSRCPGGNRSLRRAFTLIELLIVVAIIAILAAIAVPNFLEAQVRAKVSRVKADLRSVATALESYAVDTNHYPFDFAEDVAFPYYIHRGLTTPIAYMTNAARMKDVFADFKQSAANNEVRRRFRYRALSEKWMTGTPGIPFNVPSLGFDAPGMIEGRRHHGNWFMASKGPDGLTNLPSGF